jgi:hypothetical protein
MLMESEALTKFAEDARKARNKFVNYAKRNKSDVWPPHVAFAYERFETSVYAFEAAADNLVIELRDYK